MGTRESKLPTKSSANVDAFLKQVAATSPPPKHTGERARLLFSMDATASREPTWDQACQIQAEMFSETAGLGGLDIQLCYYRGFREFEATGWLKNPDLMLARMTEVRCAGGITQIGRLLRHAIAQTRKHHVNALVFVGDCVEEDIDGLCHLAGRLGLLGVPAFMFHEGYDQAAERTFKEIARLTKGAYCHFDSASPQQLRDLLSAVAVYAAGGRRALEDFGNRKGQIIRKLTHQVGQQ